ncbi:SAM-dependent methyltransferase [Actinokineospora iranica]|nr:SAM-dependent methyltransferase [Actinokineospora iranica]
MDPERPHQARVYDYLLGGACNFEPDRIFAEKFLAAMPHVGIAARLNRHFLQRAVRYCLDQGIHQFLDLGSGIPTVGNVHETAPGAHVVYVDKDPIAVACGDVELRDVPTAETVHADLCDPDAVLGSAAVRNLIDFTKPVAVLMVAVLHYIPDPHPAITRYVAEMAPGSFLVLSHGTGDGNPDNGEDVVRLHEGAGVLPSPRTHAEVTALCADLHLVPPGVVWTPLWRPDSAPITNPTDAMSYAAVARRA